MRGDPDLDIFFQTPPSEGTSEDWGQAQMIRLRTRDYQTESALGWNQTASGSAAGFPFWGWGGGGMAGKEVMKHTHTHTQESYNERHDTDNTRTHKHKSQSNNMLWKR